MRDLSLLTAFTAALFLAGCAVGPDYREPGMELPERFASADDARFVPGEVTAEFWKAFNDPQLDALVEDALRANHDLRIAVAAVDEARALRGAARLDLGPTVTASGGWADRGLSTSQAAGLPRQAEEWSAGFDAFWELDLFGRARRALEASNAELEATEAALRDVRLAVVAELVRGWFDLRGAQQRLAVATRNVANQEETLRLTEARLSAGRGTDFDTSRAAAQLAATRAGIAPLRAEVARAIHRLGVLTGREPGALREQLALPADLPALPGVVAVGDPAELLRRRPDVRVAERELAAATARVGVAVADLFPSVTFVGGIGVAAPTAGALDDAGSGTHLVAPGIRWAAFDLGRVRARIGAAEARTDAALARYEQTVLRALEETENVLTGHAEARERLAELARAAESSRTAARLARLRFENGAVDFLQVLDAERSLLQAEDQLALGRTETGTSLVDVYKALGGGWRRP